MECALSSPSSRIVMIGPSAVSEVVALEQSHFGDGLQHAQHARHRSRQGSESAPTSYRSGDTEMMAPTTTHCKSADTEMTAPTTTTEHTNAFASSSSSASSSVDSARSCSSSHSGADDSDDSDDCLDEKDSQIDRRELEVPYETNGNGAESSKCPMKPTATA